MCIYRLGRLENSIFLSGFPTFFSFFRSGDISLYLRYVFLWFVVCRTTSACL